MSKKDLLERVVTTGGGQSRRASGSADDAQRVDGDAETTRVSRTIVRRRKSDAPVEEEPPRRRTEAIVEPVKVVSAADVAASAAPKAEAEAPKPEVTAPKVVVETPKAPPEAPAALPSAAEAPPAAESPPVASAPPAAADVPPVVDARPVAPPEAVAASPRAGGDAAPKGDVRKPAPADSGTPAAVPIAAAPVDADAPRFAGLGKAVVSPPPGYDPANPHAWRRQQQATIDSAARGRRRVEAVAARAGDRRTAAPTPTAQPPGDTRGNNRPRRGRQAVQGMDRYPTKSRRKRQGGAVKAASPTPKAIKRKIRVDHVISVAQLAHELGVKAAVVIKELMELGKMSTITDMLDIDTATLVANEFEYEVENVGFQETEYLDSVDQAEEDDGNSPRPPVVTIMGHVDHGKTTLLDSIRSARVARGEAGGITQHIGAYQVEVEGGQLVTFLDTPGHQAFSAMRARGASLTDIVVLVVAVDDGVQPQTEEAINHAKAANVPIVVAINKMDKVGANADAIKQRLSDYGLLPEEWGGQTIFVPISALKGDGIDGLLEAILLQAEVLDLKANPDRSADGIVIEAKMERGRGAVATVLVQGGTLNRGDHVVLGSAFGRVRAMVDHRGKAVKLAGPSTPVELFGLSELPEVGDSLNVVQSEKNARALADHRGDAKRAMAMANTRRRTAEDLFAQASAVEREELLLVLKCDVGGSLQALRGALGELKVDGTEVRILHAAVGDMSESDVNLAAGNGALLLGFNVKVDAKARQAADQQGVETEMFSIIYHLLDRVKAQLKGLLAPEFELIRHGAAEVRQLFHISKVGTIAGCYVTDGVVGRNDTYRVLRKGVQLWEGKAQQLKRFKDDVKEVRAGFECGISLDGYNELVEGDVIEAHELKQKASV